MNIEFLINKVLDVKPLVPYLSRKCQQFNLHKSQNILCKNSLCRWPMFRFVLNFKEKTNP